MKKFYPIFLDVNKKKCVVIGGGQVAERRIKSLLDCDAAVKVVSPELSPGIQQMAKQGLIEVVNREFHPDDLADAILTIAASNQVEVNRKVVDEAREKRVLVDDSSTPEEGDFILNVQ